MTLAEGQKAYEDGLICACELGIIKGEIVTKEQCIEMCGECLKALPDCPVVK